MRYARGGTRIGGTAAMTGVVLLTGLGAVSCRSAAPTPPAAPPAVSLPAPPPRGLPAVNPAIVRTLTERGLEAREVAEGVVIYLPAVHFFEFNRAEVDAPARTQLRDLAAMLNEPQLAGRRIVVEGHADGVGSPEYNLTLSERRADAVIDVLAEYGVPRARLRRRAYGQAQPIAPNRLEDGRDNPEGRARNRRVALVLENPVK